jgi:hypothetical protein
MLARSQIELNVGSPFQAGIGMSGETCGATNRLQRAGDGTSTEEALVQCGRVDIVRQSQLMVCPCPLVMQNGSCCVCNLTFI